MEDLTTLRLIEECSTFIFCPYDFYNLKQRKLYDFTFVWSSVWNMLDYTLMT